MASSSIILYAAGSPLLVDFEEVCLKNNIDIKAIIDNQPNYPAQSSVPEKVISLKKLSNYQHIPFLVPLFSPHHRFTAVQEAIEKNLNPYPLLSDRNNDLPIHFLHGAGCFINKRVVIGAQSQLGDYVCINRGATLGHHLLLESFVSIGPGVITGGNVTIKRGALIGTGAVILPQRTIGKHAIVGAGAVVTKNVDDHQVVIGNPAVVIKQNKKLF